MWWSVSVRTFPQRTRYFVLYYGIMTIQYRQPTEYRELAEISTFLHKWKTRPKPLEREQSKYKYKWSSGAQSIYIVRNIVIVKISLYNHDVIKINSGMYLLSGFWMKLALLLEWSHVIHQLAWEVALPWQYCAILAILSYSIWRDFVNWQRKFKASHVLLSEAAARVQEN